MRMIAAFVEAIRFSSEAILASMSASPPAPLLFSPAAFVLLPAPCRVGYLLVFRCDPSTFRNVLKRTVEALYVCLPDWELKRALEERESDPRRLNRLRNAFARKGRGYMA